MVYTSLVVNLIGQRSPDVIGRLTIGRLIIGTVMIAGTKTNL